MTFVGPRSGQYAVELAVRNTLRTWLRTYTAAAARRNVLLDEDYMTPEELEALLTNQDNDGLPLSPRSGIHIAAAFGDWNTQSLPHIQVISPAYNAAGGDDRGLSYRYEIQVAALVGAQSHPDTRFLRSCYEDAIPGVLLQQQDLGGIATSVRHIGGGAAEVSEVNDQDSATFQGTMSVFEVFVQAVLDPIAGPAFPDPLPDVNGVPPVYPPDGVADEDSAEVVYVPRPLDAPVVDPDA